MMSDDTIRTLRDGKAALRQQRRRASLEDKLVELVRLQHIYVQIVSSRRPLLPIEKPWPLDEDKGN